jgi:membrane protease subunit HflC
MNRTFGRDFFSWPAIRPRFIRPVIVTIVVFIILVTSVYQISPEEIGVILRFGQFVRTAEPGLHLKVPFIQKVHYFEKRWLEWDGDPNQIPPPR